jgi:hypothetical protein
LSYSAFTESTLLISTPSHHRSTPEWNPLLFNHEMMSHEPSKFSPVLICWLNMSLLIPWLFIFPGNSVKSVENVMTCAWAMSKSDEEVLLECISVICYLFTWTYYCIWVSMRREEGFHSVH